MTTHRYSWVGTSTLAVVGGQLDGSLAARWAKRFGDGATAFTVHSDEDVQIIDGKVVLVGTTRFVLGSDDNPGQWDLVLDHELDDEVRVLNEAAIACGAQLTGSVYYNYEDDDDLIVNRFRVAVVDGKVHDEQPELYWPSDGTHEAL